MFGRCGRGASGQTGVAGDTRSSSNSFGPQLNAPECQTLCVLTPRTAPLWGDEQGPEAVQKSTGESTHIVTGRLVGRLVGSAVECNTQAQTCSTAPLFTASLQGLGTTARSILLGFSPCHVSPLLGKGETLALEPRRRWSFVAGANRHWRVSARTAAPQVLRLFRSTKRS